MSKLEWEQYEERSYHVRLAGYDFNLSSYRYNTSQDDKWELNLDSIFSVESKESGYTAEQAKIWAEQEIFAYLRGVVEKILKIVEPLRESEGNG